MLRPRGDQWPTAGKRKAWTCECPPRPLANLVRGDALDHNRPMPSPGIKYYYSYDTLHVAEAILWALWALSTSTNQRLLKWSGIAIHVSIHTRTVEVVLSLLGLCDSVELVLSFPFLLRLLLLVQRQATGEGRGVWGRVVTRIGVVNEKSLTLYERQVYICDVCGSCGLLALTVTCQPVQ